MKEFYNWVYWEILMGKMMVSSFKNAVSVLYLEFVISKVKKNKCE